MGPSFVLNLILCLLTSNLIQIATSIRVYDVQANDANIGSQTAVISWKTDTTTDSLNSTIRGFRIDANYLFSRKGHEILDPDINNATLMRLRSGVTYRACVIVLINNMFRGNKEIHDNSACVSFTTDFVPINSYSLTALGIAICIIILFIVTQLIDFLCPREGSKQIEDLEEGDKNESRKKSHNVAEDSKREPSRSNRKKRSRRSDSKRKPQTDKDRHQKGMNKKKNVDGSKGGGGKHKSVKA
ncbi:uncharacterized protein LOC117106615 [Anneissia japonica]|uniref:uncharacterized protein LOC117106615 n=1 Tax=Anneissia japonica TaxID=1529436 RepID=UPI0014254B29|nr:uncharacterized protein LOC117106615 [Anneissia japonica]XP_033103898.1 uncharacterized protein LOC117106615 [Anneissia japonica]